MDLHRRDPGGRGLPPSISRSQFGLRALSANAVLILPEMAGLKMDIVRNLF